MLGKSEGKRRRGWQRIRWSDSSVDMLLLLSRFSCVQLCVWQPIKLLCPWDSPGKNTGMGCHFSCEIWTKKKVEHQRTDNFELWCWRRLLRVPWTARRSNQSILKEINPEYSLEGLMLKLNLQYFGHLMRRTDSLEKTLVLGKIEGRRRRG